MYRWIPSCSLIRSNLGHGCIDPLEPLLIFRCHPLTVNGGDRNLPVVGKIPENLGPCSSQVAAVSFLYTITANLVATAIAAGGAADISCGGDANGEGKKSDELHGDRR